jgi:hypothetical protein
MNYFEKSIKRGIQNANQICRVLNEIGHSEKKANCLKDEIEMLEIGTRMRHKSNCASVSPSIYDISKWIELWDISKFLKRGSWPILCVRSQKQKKELLQKEKNNKSYAQKGIKVACQNKTFSNLRVFYLFIPVSKTDEYGSLCLMLHIFRSTV